MTARGVALGLTLICVLLGSAVTAQVAAASNATAVTCTAKVGGLYKDSTCNETGAPNEFEKVGFAGSTKVVGETEGTSILKSTIVAGLDLELSVPMGQATGVMENKEPSPGVMEATGTSVIVYTSVTANHGCAVTGSAPGTITTTTLRAHTLSPTQIKVEPVSGTKIAEFELSGCAPSTLNGLWTVEGSVVGVVTGTKLVFAHGATTTAPSALTVSKIGIGSRKAGIASTMKIKNGSNGTPLALE